MDTQVVELGPLNATIHQVNECVSVDDLESLTLVYRQVLQNILV
jgi:succinyl-diaminopimelate desuccinylase